MQQREKTLEDLYFTGWHFGTDIRRAALGQNFNIDTVLATIRVGSVTWNNLISYSKLEETHETSSSILTYSQPSEI